MVRNLSWRADSSSKLALREAGTATALMHAAMLPASEQTLKSILCALWNVSGHCVENKAAICAVPGALEFLVGLLEYRSPSKSLAVVENAGRSDSLAYLERKGKKSIYIAPFTVIHSKRSGVDHTVLPANNITPAFPS